MERSDRPARRAVLLGATILLSAVLTSCAGQGPVSAAPAARVGDRTISIDELIDQVEADRQAQISMAEQWGEEAVDQLRASFEATPDHTLPMAEVTDSLSRLVLREVLADVLARHGGEVSPDDRSAAQASVENAGGQGLDPVLQEDTYALIEALERVIEPDEADLREEFEEQRLRYQQICYSGMIVETEEEAVEVAALLEGGTPFADLFDRNIEESVEASGGELGCQAAADLEATLGWNPAEAPVGTILEISPAPTGGMAIVAVTGVDTPEFEDIREQLAAATAQQVILDEVERSSGIVELNPRYGTWDAPTRMITGPTDPLAVAAPTPGPMLVPS